MCVHVFPKSSFLFSSNCNVLWDRLIKQIFQECFKIYLIPLLRLLYFSCKNYAEKQRDRQEQIDTIQGQVMTLQMAFTYNRKSF